MAMKRSFYTVDGEIIGESSGSTTINYATDALGSVTGTLVGGQLQNTYAYKPYGSLLAKSGGSGDPRFQWRGARACARTGRAFADYCWRSRPYSSVLGLWPDSRGAEAAASGQTLFGGRFQASVPVCGKDAGYTWGELKAKFKPVHINTEHSVGYSAGLDQCDSAWFQSHWLRPKGSTQGAIIQQVSMRIQAWDCRDKHGTIKSWSADYIEAWNVDPDGIEIDGFDQFVTWSIAEFVKSYKPPLDITCLTGKATTTGLVGYVEGCQAAKDTWKDNVFQANGLLAVNPTPPQFDPGPGLKSLTFNFDWGCVPQTCDYTAWYQPDQILLHGSAGGSCAKKKECCKC